MKLIVGLGNIGKEYEATRHNIGFMVLDELARRWGVNTWKNDRNALCGEYRIPEKVLLLKPTTYMNLSGESIRSLTDYYKVPMRTFSMLIRRILLWFRMILTCRQGRSEFAAKEVRVDIMGLNPCRNI